MAFKIFSHQAIIGLSFGLTTAVITTLGMIVGVNAATSLKLAVVASIIIVAIADGLSDAIGLHVAEETEMEKGGIKHTKKEIWLTTLFTFLSVSGFSLTFVIPILIFPLKMAIIVAICWGIFLLICLNFYIAKIRKEKPIKLILEHIFLALFVILISHLIGSQIPKLVK